MSVSRLRGTGPAASGPPHTQLPSSSSIAPLLVAVEVLPTQKVVVALGRFLRVVYRVAHLFADADGRSAHGWANRGPRSTQPRAVRSTPTLAEVGLAYTSRTGSDSRRNHRFSVPVLGATAAVLFPHLTAFRGRYADRRPRPQGAETEANSKTVVQRQPGTDRRSVRRGQTNSDATIQRLPGNPGSLFSELLGRPPARPGDAGSVFVVCLFSAYTACTKSPP